jgi:hypothetical protein
VHRLLGEQVQDRGTQRAAPGLGSKAARSVAALAAMAATTGTAGMTVTGVIARRVVVSMAAQAADRRVGGMSDGQGWVLLSS